MNSKQKFSDKVTVLSFLLCVGVVVQHTQWLYRESTWMNAIHDFLFFMVEVCVPFFFMLSGYLFFRTYSPEKWKEKLASRVRTLLIPYLIWNAVYVAFMMTLSKFNLIGQAIEVDGLGVILLWLNSETSPLWFVKYLMGFVLVSPLMYFVWKRRVLGAMVLVGLIALNIYNYYAGITQVPLNVNANNLPMFCYQYIFFAVGSYAALNLRDVMEVPTVAKTKIGTIAVLLLIVAYWCLIRQYGDTITNHTFRLLFCIAFWFAYDGMKQLTVRPWMKYSFFIYCSHLLLIMSAQGLTRLLFSRTGLDILHMPEYFLLPVVVTIAIIWVANLLKHLFPRVWSVITGARG